MGDCAQLDGLKTAAASAGGKVNVNVKNSVDSYQTAVTNLQNKINSCMNNGPLKEIGGLQQDILTLQGDIKAEKTELDIARARHDAIMGGEKKVSDYQGVSAMLGFFKPLRESSVAVLIALGIFLVFLSIYVLSFMSKSGGAAVAAYNSGLGLGSTFAGFDKRSFLYGVGVVGVIVGTLAYFGLYGKRLN
jgi:hypothetical protein